MCPKGKNDSREKFDLSISIMNSSCNGSPQRTLWCELPEVQNAGFLGLMDERQRKLQEAYFEVLTSEASYLSSLSFFVSHFLTAHELTCPNNHYPVISSSDRKQLFSNIGALRKCSERLLYRLESRLNDNALVLNDLCDILSEHFRKHFRPYIDYCSTQLLQVRLLSRLRAKNPEFVACVQRLEADVRCQGLTLQSFLMLPMQRITRYPLLLSAIISHLRPGQQQYSTAMRALKLANHLVHACNEAARKTEQSLERLPSTKEASKQLELLLERSQTSFVRFS